ncbi:Aldehyde dehydrogenase (NAD+) [Candidatus Koribacter versatilis Ellin345]|uniref:Aldehyde dehydrogenase (NAD+) n=1 Tax=Koribacter versatilis (strain Ellin345) TaxID=204669 RepID=Q1IRN9_KORVE|nr:aldehyde dehydrogenase family protein [Candidatus Koribacter versatilis]ABF40461.1 Aldehyde dehydrogenase (NAD+) [Candidatus Koribacter versatilis Ellin345]
MATTTAETAKATVYKNLIDGEWVESKSGQTFENLNPADTREVVGIFQRSGKEDVEHAIDAASEAYKKWRLVPAPRRAELLFKAAAILEQRKEKYSQEMTREMGKVIKETRGDVQEAIDAGYYNAGEGRRMFGPTTPSELPNKFAMAVRQPLGVCAMITPWNFPMAIPSWKLFPALVCGNTAVIKPAQDTPLSTFNFVQALNDAGVPKGVINIVTGYGGEVGTPMTEHPEVKAVSLTGSTAVGRIVGQAAAKSFKHCSLELGGKNPMIVLDDANLDLALEGALWGSFGTTGQRCTATSRIILQKGIYKKFADELVARARKLKVGNGLDETVDMGPAVNENQMNTDLKYIEIGKGEGAKLAHGGHRLDKGDYAHGWFLEPTIFTDVNHKMRIAQEEIFGPVVALIPCDDLDEAIEIANGIEYGLSSAIYTRDVNKSFRAMRDLHAGITYVNAPTIGAEVHMPFGGVKATGNGHREGGIGALDFYTEWKAIYVDYSDTLQRAQIDNRE